MGKLSASILAADLARLGEEVKLVEPYAEVIHVDIMDGHFVPPIALGAVVVRSLRPGWSFQQLNPEVYPRLEATRAQIDRRNPAVDLEIDGGVKVENAARAIGAGASVLVAASGVFAQPDPVAAARALAEIAATEPARPTGKVR